MNKVWDIYFKKLKEIYGKGTEHTPRASFENLLEELKGNPEIKITHEPRRTADFGAPDFKIERAGAIIGYIETKALGENLNQVRKSPQIKKYLAVAHNLILTNYTDFILFKNGKVFEEIALCSESDIAETKGKIDEKRTQEVEGLFNKFFLSEPLKIGKAKDLAIHLAERGKILREYIQEALNHEDGDQFSEKLNALFEAFKSTLVEDLTKDEFADAYAQTVLYGFFLAYLQSGTRISVEDANRLVPSSFEVIKEFFTVINDYTVPDNVLWIFNEIVNLLNNVDADLISKSLSFKKPHDKVNKDPYLYFYETFLGEFDAKKKKAKGVYYTPVQVVDFITRSLNALLEKEFRKEKGFADPSVTVLDFAAGTGTFLVSIFELVFESISKDRGKLPRLIKEHLLKNFYGFEYLVAPYAVAHLKLSQLLKDTGHQLEPHERLQVYLTDTLDNAEHKAIGMMPYLTQEGKDATRIKTRHPILVITGNPPYNIKSRNNKPWITELLNDYKPRGEKNIQPLSDDYIKFIRYAHWKIHQTQQGLIGIITNNSFLSGIIHRTMRAQLLNEFDQIYILNLHGNAKYHETQPDGSEDQNVFDIQQGVCISLFVRSGDVATNERRASQIYYADLWGTREDKYDFLMDNDITSLEWEKLNPSEFDESFRKTRWGKQFNDNFNFFIPMRNAIGLKEYGDFWGLQEIFQSVTSGVETGNDAVYVKYKQTFSESDQFFVKRFLFRPFDLRYVAYDPKMLRRASYEVLQNMLDIDNIALFFPRFALQGEFDYGMVSSSLGDRKAGGKNSGSETYIAPLYVSITGESEIQFSGKHSSKPNYSSDFAKFIKSVYSREPEPMEVLGYFYAILYCPTYRSTFLEFLKIDFPRIPFVKDQKLFEKLSALGRELIDQHLMKQTYPSNVVSFPVPGGDEIDEVRYEETQNGGAVFINKKQYFGNVPPKIWKFTIGGYPVLEKWLKSRRDREENTLSYEEQGDFIKICNILSFTITQMQKIDEAAKPLFAKK
jgi:type I restriction-modification system DNA methylase subunit